MLKLKYLYISYVFCGIFISLLWPVSATPSFRRCSGFSLFRLFYACGKIYWLHSPHPTRSRRKKFSRKGVKGKSSLTWISMLAGAAKEPNRKENYAYIYVTGTVGCVCSFSSEDWLLSVEGKEKMENKHEMKYVEGEECRRKTINDESSFAAVLPYVHHLFVDIQKILYLCLAFSLLFLHKVVSTTPLSALTKKRKRKLFPFGFSLKRNQKCMSINCETMNSYFLCLLFFGA